MSSKKPKILGKNTRISSPFDITTHKTEWTCAAKLAEWMNSIVKEKNLPLGTAEVETTQEGDKKRVDIILFDSPTSQKVLCVIETKQPYFDVFNEDELKEPARKKASKRKAPYFVTCNFQLLIWFNTERVNKMEPEERQIHEKYNLSDIENLDYIEEPRFKNSIISGLEKFLEELVEVRTGKKPEPLLPIDEFLIFRLQEKVYRLARYYRLIIRDTTHKDAGFRKKLQIWFKEQQWQFTWSDADYERVARQTAYLLINKILFYHLLKAKKTYLSSLDIPDDLVRGGQLQAQLQAHFNYVLENIDYETIYSTDFIDQIAFPDNKEVVCEIKELLNTFKRHDFSEIGYEIIGSIFQRLIPQEERHNLGQYFTNPDVVDLILKFCLRHENDKIMDPACGAGTFLMRAYRHKKIMNAMLSHSDILETLWGVDIAKFPSHLSMINLALQDLSVDKNYPNVAQEDFFNLLTTPEGLELPDRWRKIKAKTLGVEERKITYPRRFDCIVGNPPYTRQEEISEITGTETYKEKMIKSALYDLHNNKIANISKRAGIHAYFFIHGMKFLREGGRFGFIVSNSWLDVDYGKGLQEFFLKNYKIVAIIESKVERWFEEADINTCIVILEKCKEKEERDKNCVKFVYLFKTLRHFIPATQKMWEGQINRLDAIGNLIKTIHAHKEFYQNEELRIYPKLQSELWDEGHDKENKKYVGLKWGKYIRAPEIFFKILEKGKDKLVPLKKVADVRRGFTTGANEFFYLTETEIKQWGIEKEFLQPVIFSLKEVDGYILDKNILKHRAIICSKDKEKLKGTNLLKYIREGERKNFHRGPTCSSREPWYSLGKGWSYASLIFPAKVGERMPVFLNKGVFEDKKLYGILPKPKIDKTLLAGLLNSTLSRFFIDNTCTQLTGAQAIADINVNVVENLSIPNPSKLALEIQELLRESIDKLCMTSCDSIFTELGASSPEEISLDKIKPERRELDKIIMGDILGLTKEEQLEVYRAVIDLVKSRIEKAENVEKRTKTEEGIDIDAFIKTVMDKIAEKTLAKFYQEKILTHKPLYLVTLPKLAGEIRIKKELGLSFGKESREYRLSSGKNHIFCKSEIEAQYLKVWLEAGLENVKVPKNESYLAKITPQLEKLMEEIKKVIESYTDSILQPKLRQKILHQLWQKLTEEVE